MTRDDVHAGDPGPLSWTEQARPETLLRDLLTSVNGRLPYPDGSRCWVAYVTFPGDRWNWTRVALAVLRPAEIVMKGPDRTVADGFAATAWQSSLHFAHRSSREPDVPDAELLAYRQDSPDRDRR